MCAKGNGCGGSPISILYRKTKVEIPGALLSSRPTTTPSSAAAERNAPSHSAEADASSIAESTGNHRAQIHRHQPLLLEQFGDVAAHDAAGEAFGNGRLAHAGFADQHRIVLVRRLSTCITRRISSSRTDDRVNLPLLCQCGQVAAVFVKRLEFGFGIFVGYALVAAQFDERFEHGVALQAVFGKNLFERRPGAVQ